ncbi:MAG: acyl-CoA dehydrogenase [Acidobacteria bacterium]|nr:MAG: acyl-CoA dehydrogenase [Acidobacteriota bacterium]
MPDLEAVRPFLEPRHLAIAHDALAFAEAEIRPLPEPADDDAGRRQARAILERLGRSGLLRHAVPAAYGGAGDAPDLRALCLIRETLAAASPLADDVFAIQCLVALPLAVAGSEEQKRRLLPRLVRGAAMAAFAMTERDAGSDVGAIASRARRDGAGWRLEGAKSLISNAGIADVYLIFAATDPGAGRRGLSLFLVAADHPGLRFAGAQVLAAAHPLGEIVLDGCRVGAEALVGEEGEGFALGMHTLDRLRATVAAAACGLAQRALDEALAHARRRRQFGRPLADFQLVQQKLARSATELAASRLLTYRAAHAADAGRERISCESAMAKLFATEAAQRAVDDAVQILGGRGVLADHPVDRLYRSVRALRIYEGTSEIQQLVIARRLLRPSD